MGIFTMVVLFFLGITILCIIGYVLAPKKRFLEILENNKASGTTSFNLVGTSMYGWKMLDEKQLKYYGLEPNELNKELYKKYGSTMKGIPFYEQKHIPKFKTKFISIIYPLFPLATQVVFNEEEGGLETSFYAIRVRMYWKQSFGIMAISYGNLLAILVFIFIMFPIFW